MASADFAKREWIREFTKPINVLSIFLALAGIVTGYYFYVKAEKVPEISWSILTRKIFDASNPIMGFSILDSSGSPIKDNIYASEITIWNSGSALLESGEPGSLVRSPLTVTLDQNARLLSAVVSQTTSNEAPDSVVLQVHPPTVAASWKHLDPSAGFKISLLSAGVFETSVNLDINIGGMKELRFAPASASISDFLDDMWNAHTFLFLIALTLLILLVFAITLYATRFLPTIEKLLANATFTSLLAFLVVYFAIIAVVAGASAGSLYIAFVKPRIPADWSNVWEPGFDVGDVVDTRTPPDKPATIDTSRGDAGKKAPAKSATKRKDKTTSPSLHHGEHR